MVMQCVSFFQQVDSWIDPKKFDLNKYTSNSSIGCVLEVDLEYLKELNKLHNDYSLAPDKIELKKEMLSNYELIYEIPIGNVKKLVPNFFHKEKYVLHYENLQLYLIPGLKKYINQSQWSKPYIEFNTQKIKAEKLKLINNAVYSKTMENLRNRIDARLVSNEKDYLKWISKSSYMLLKIFDDDLVTIRKSKVILTFDKPAYTGMRILELSKVLMYKFHYDYIKNIWQWLKTIIQRHW